MTSTLDAADMPGAAGSAADRVYQALRERILAFELPPDTILARADLARALGVSQTPVREALQRLEQDGLVRVYPQSRTQVARIDEGKLNEVHFLRVALECEVARRLAGQENHAVVKRLRGLVRLQESLLGDPSQMDLFHEFDVAFHRTLFDAVGMRPLHAMLARRLGHLIRCQRLELPRKGKMSEIVHGHLAIIEGIASGDPDLAAAAMRGHIGATIRRVATLREDHPQYFQAAEA